MNTDIEATQDLNKFDQSYAELRRSLVEDGTPFSFHIDIVRTLPKGADDAAIDNAMRDVICAQSDTVLDIPLFFYATLQATVRVLRNQAKDRPDAAEKEQELYAKLKELLTEMADKVLVPAG